MTVLLDLCSRGHESHHYPHHRDNIDGTSANPLTREIAAARLRKILDQQRECAPAYAYRYPECEMEAYPKWPSMDFEFKWLR